MGHGSHGLVLVCRGDHFVDDQEMTGSPRARNLHTVEAKRALGAAGLAVGNHVSLPAALLNEQRRDPARITKDS